MKQIKAFFIIVVILHLIFQLAYSYETRTAIVRQKLNDGTLNFKDALNGGSNQVYHLPRVRPITLRDSGRDETLMFLENTQFRFIGDIGFYVPHLMVTLKSNDPSAPVIFDDPTAFFITVHKGSIVLSATELNALFNHYVFNIPNPPLKDLRFSTSPGVLTLTGSLFRGRWIPFSMKGGVHVREGRFIDYRPTIVLIDGVDATKLLTVANVKLDELLKIKTPGAELIGSTITLDALKIFPPPRLDMKIKTASVNDKGLLLEFNDGKAAPFSKPFALPSNSHIILRGGDVKFLRVMPLNVFLQIDSIQAGEKLDFCLYRYQEQLARGNLSLTAEGNIHVFFPTPDCAY